MQADNPNFLDESQEDSIAIIGMALRLPGAKDANALWSLLNEGRSHLRAIPPTRWSIGHLYDPAFKKPGHTVNRVAGLLDDIDQFDASFFGISPREAASLDPQQRLMLETTWHALEDAGLSLDEIPKDRMGVYAATMANDYHQHTASPFHTPDAFSATGTYAAFLSNRISHYFGWRGDSVTVDTACASSLTALHLARTALLRGSIDCCIVGAVNLLISPWRAVAFSHAGMLSPAGQCKTFSDQADGYVPGEGVVALVLRRTRDAIKAGDRILGLLHGSAINHMGATPTLTSPSIEAECHLIQRALAEANMKPDLISYVECHGTGTPLGDPIEVEALAQVFSERRVSIGSIKSNVGHLEAAAGLAGVAKVLLMLRQRVIPPTLHAYRGNPLIDFDHISLFPAGPSCPWISSPRLAGISAFGFGGAGGHVIIGEAPRTTPVPCPVSSQIERTESVALLISATNRKSLQQVGENLAAQLRSDPSIELEQLSQALRLQRTALSDRRCLWVKSLEEASCCLEDLSDDDPLPGLARSPQLELHLGNRYHHGDWLTHQDEIPALGQLARQVQKRWMKLGIDPEDDALRLYLAARAWLALLEQLGLQFEAMSAYGSFRPAAMALAGMLDDHSAAQMALSGVLKQEHVRRPKCRYHDGSSDVWMTPVRPAPESLMVLRPESEMTRSLLDLAQRLWRSNPTFRSALLGYQEAFDRVIEERLLNGPNDDAGLALLSAVALWKTCERWSMRPPKAATQWAAWPLAGWVAEQWVPLELGLSVVRDQSAPEDLITPLAMLPFYPNEQRHVWLASERGHVPEWASLVAPFDTSESPQDDALLKLTLSVGASNTSAGSAPVCLKLDLSEGRKGLERVLAELWAHGADIRFSALGLHKPRLDLPLYPFQRASYWLPRLPITPTLRLWETGTEWYPLTPTQDRPMLPQSPADMDWLIKIRQCVAETLESTIDAIDQDTLLSRQGIDSLLSMELAARIEKVTGVKLSPSTIEQIDQIRGLAAHVAKEASSRTSEGGGERLTVAHHQVIHFENAGILDSLRFSTTPMGSLEADQLRIKVHAAGLNFRDLMVALKALPNARDEAIGLEFCGDIVEVGANVNHLQPGQRVFGVGFGTLTDYLTVSSELVCQAPEKLDHALLAALPIAYLTALRCLEDLEPLRPGMTLLIHSATGGLGQAALYLAQSKGARIFATAGTADKRAWLLNQGVEAAFDSRTLDFGRHVLEATGGRGVDCILNSLTGPALDTGLACLAAGGLMIDVGKKDIRNPDIISRDYPHRRYRSYDLVDEIRYQSALIGERLTHLAHQVNKGQLPPLPVKTFPLKDTAKALHHMARAQHQGKIVLVNGGVQSASSSCPLPTRPAIADFPMAVIGYAGRFPGAADCGDLWEVLKTGRRQIAKVPQGRWTPEEIRIFSQQVNDRNLLSYGGFMPDADGFDPAWFGFSPREARATDPRQRILLTEVWKALYAAGLEWKGSGHSLSESMIGFFVGADAGDYGFKRVLAGLKGDPLVLGGNLPSSLAARLAHHFDCTGPALTLDMSCVASFGALWAAEQALSEGRCRIAVVAAISLQATPLLTAQLASAGLISPSQYVRPFSKKADGMIPAEACVALVLKPLEQAKKEGDPIHAIVRGIEVAHDGLGQGFSLPDPYRLAETYRGCLTKAGVGSEEIDMISAHGVGTPGGDSAEMQALSNTFLATERPRPITSTKPLLGHTLATAGLTAIVQTILQFRHQYLLSPCFDTEDLIAEWDSEVFNFEQPGRPWPERSDAKPHRVLIEAYAINGGIGAVILEDPAKSDRPLQPLPQQPPHKLTSERFWLDQEQAASRDQDQPLDRVIEAFRLELSEVLQEKPERIPLESPPFALGLSSLLAIELQHRLLRRFGLCLRIDQILGVSRIDQLVALLPEGLPVSEPQIEGVPEDTTPNATFPLTPLQAAYWSGRQPEVPLGGTDCQVFWSFLLAKDWPVLELEQAWNRLIAAHPMLRGVIDEKGQQRVLDEVPYYVFESFESEEGITTEDRGEAVREQMATRTIPPDQWPLFRIATYHDGNHRHLLLALNLMVIDVLSLYQLLDQLADLASHPKSEPVVPGITFRQCVIQKADLHHLEAFQRAEQFWASRGPSLPPAPNLPMTKPLSQFGPLKTHRLQTRLSLNESSSLLERARRVEHSPSEILLALFAGVIAHWARSPTFTLNVTTHNRLPIHRDVNQVIGNFTDTVLIHIDASGDPPFLSLLQKVSHRLREHLEYANYSGVKVMRHKSAHQGFEAGLMPVVFTSMLGYESLRETLKIGHGGTIGRLLEGATRTPQVTLDAQVQLDQGELLLSWDIAKEVFPPDLPEAMFAAWTAAARELTVQEPHVFVISKWLAEREVNIRQIANADKGPIPEEPLFAGFLRQAARHPERVALLDDEGPLTYGELRKRCLALAVAVRDRGVKHGALVGVAMHKSSQQIVAAIALQMAGAAYLPLAHDLPEQRIRKIAQQSGITLLLTAAETALSLPPLQGVDTLAVSRDEPWYDSVDDDALGSVHADDLAYVIFTSGSTGDPKGVMMTHRAALNTCWDINRRFAIRSTDRVLALSSLSFDLSVWDLFGVLSAGGAIVLPKPESANDPAYLARCVHDHRVTIWNSVPMYLELLLAGEPPADDLASLRLVMLSGDWIAPGLAARIRASVPSVDVHSLGGATEAGIWSIHFPIPEEPLKGWQSIPYGRSMDNQTFMVLDEALKPCPEGVTGELFIGGIGLSLGYWRDEQRTAQAFINHPVTGERLYRTGDLGRWRAGGLIEFLGRRDGQVKIDGFRVELGEIEAVLRNHPAVREAVAVAPEEGHHRRRLSAFVTLDSDTSPEELIALVKQHLPAYMVPRHLRVLDRFPLNENEKVDRRALVDLARQPAEESLERGPLASAPKALESQLVTLWGEIISESIGLNELPDPNRNLFELGADSLMAVTASRRITREFGIPCSVTDIFADATIKGLAAALALRSRESQGFAQPPKASKMSSAERRRAFRSQMV